MKHNIVVSSTSWELRNLERPMHRKYHLNAMLDDWLINSSQKEHARIAADSTMFRIVNLLIALSLGVHLEQLEQRMGLTWPRPFLFRPLQQSQH
jgi:hypothetical protein